MPQDFNIHIERAHRSLADKPKDEQAPSHSITVRLQDYYTKDVLLQQAWKQREVTYEGGRVYFDQYYSPEIHRQWKEVRQVIKQLWEKGIKA